MRSELQTLFSVWDTLLSSGHSIAVDNLDTSLGRISCTVFKSDHRRFVAKLKLDQSELHAADARQIVDSVRTEMPNIPPQQLPLAVFFDRNTGTARLGLHNGIED